MAPSGPSVSKSYLNSCLIASESYLMASDSTCVACKKSFGAQFIESSGNDCLKTQTDFDEAFAEAFPNIVIKSQSRNNEELHKSEEVANVERNENDETLFCDSHFETTVADKQVAAQPYLCHGMLIKLYFEVLIKMMEDLLTNLEDFKVLVMHCVC